MIYSFDDKMGLRRKETIGFQHSARRQTHYVMNTNKVMIVLSLVLCSYWITSFKVFK